jgi:hypothetical protein
MDVTADIERFLAPPPLEPVAWSSSIHGYRDYWERRCKLCSKDIKSPAFFPGKNGQKRSFDSHESGARHKKMQTKLPELWTSYYRLKVEHTHGQHQLRQIVTKARLSKQQWLKVSKFTSHLPWQQEFKSALFDFQQSEESQDIGAVEQVAASIEKKERLALVLLSFIKERATCGGQISLFEIRGPDFVFGSSRPWAQELSRLTSTDGHVIMNRIQEFV